MKSERLTHGRSRARMAVAGIVITSALIFGGSNQLAASNPVSETKTELGECLKDKRRLSVLWLIDQSRSLEDTDPFGLRAVPLTATLQLLASLETSQSDTPIQIIASVMGFGDGSTVKQDWVTITPSNVETIREVINRESSLQKDSFTQYNRALRGALKQFENPLTEDSCRLMFWFSDGQHDFDNTDSRLTDQEQNQIRGDICGNGGLADQLRKAQVRTWAVGLNQVEEKLELMHLISENAGEYKVGAFSVTAGQCGSEPPLGKYVYAIDTDRIADIIDDLPGTPANRVNPGNCGIADCSEIRFVADASITGFKMRLTRPSEDTEVSIRLPDQEDIGVFSSRDESMSGGYEEIRQGPVRVIRISTNEAIILVQATNGESLSGEWLVQFLGRDASNAIGRVSFEGQVAISVVDDLGKPVDVIDRFEPIPVRIRVSGSGENTQISPTALETSLRALGNSENIDVEVERDGTFRIPSDAVGEILRGPFASALAVEISAVPVATVEGLTTVDGKPISVVFRETSTTVGISNGKNFPTFLPSSSKTELSVRDTEPLRIEFKFRGPDAVDGEVRLARISPTFNNANDFAIQGVDTCRIPASTEVTCVFELKPGSNGYGSRSIPLELLLDSPKAEDAQTQAVAVDVFMTRSPNVGKGVRNALFLIFGFLIVQFAIRLLTALALSRFESLDATARRVRIPVRVSRDGGISGIGTAELIVAPVGSPDTVFAVEMTERQRSFSIFGYSYETSVLKTFFRPMSRPIGEVSLADRHVFGSAGSSIPKARAIASQRISGRVDLTLRRQWTISLSELELIELQTRDAEGELVAILDPFELNSVTNQLSELQMSVGTSQFGADIELALERLENSRAIGDRESEPSDENLLSREPTSTPSQFVDPFESLETTAMPHTDGIPQESSLKKGRRTRSGRKSQGLPDDRTASNPFSFGPDDPFS